MKLDKMPRVNYRVPMQSGPEQFKDWMHRRRFLQREAAEYLGFQESYVSQLLNGVRVPAVDNAIHIEEMTGVPVRAWRSSDTDTSAVAGNGKSAKARHNKA